MTYKDLGFNDDLSFGEESYPFLGFTNTSYFEGLDASQLLSVGRIQSPDGQWYIDFDKGDVSLPLDSVKTTQINYASRGINAVVSNTGGGDFVDIQEAIDYVNRRGGGTVFIKAGTYYPDETITLYSKTNLVGDGPGKTILDFQDQEYGIEAIGTNTLLQNLSDTAFQYVLIQNMKIKSSSKSDGAIKLRFVRNAIVRDCFFSSNSRSIHIDSCWPSEISGCTVESGSPVGNDYAFYVQDCKISIFNNIMSGYDGSAGIYVFGQGNQTSTQIFSNNFDQVDTYAIHAETTYDLHIFDNHFYASSDASVYTSSSATSCSRVVVSNNTFTGIGAASAAIQLNDTNDSSVIGNNMNGSSGGYGIYITSNSDYIQILGNYARSFSTGIELVTGSSRHAVVGNNVYNCTTKITDNSTSSVVANNVIS